MGWNVKLIGVLTTPSVNCPAVKLALACPMTVDPSTSCTTTDEATAIGTGIVIEHGLVEHVTAGTVICDPLVGDTTACTPVVCDWMNAGLRVAEAVLRFSETGAACALIDAA